MTNEIIHILIKLAAVLVAYGICKLLSAGAKYLKAKLSNEQHAALDKFIGELTAAAEQMLKKDDVDGSARLGYVQEMLIEAGYDITEAIRAMIESHVHKINSGGGAAK